MTVVIRGSRRTSKEATDFYELSTHAHLHGHELWSHDCCPRRRPILNGPEMNTLPRLPQRSLAAQSL